MKLQHDAMHTGPERPFPMSLHCERTGFKLAGGLSPKSGPLTWKISVILNQRVQSFWTSCVTEQLS